MLLINFIIFFFQLDGRVFVKRLDGDKSLKGTSQLYVSTLRQVHPTRSHRQRPIYYISI